MCNCPTYYIELHAIPHARVKSEFSAANRVVAINEILFLREDWGQLEEVADEYDLQSPEWTMCESE